MSITLIVAALAMGVASSPHCAVMCGAPCAALTHGSLRSATGFHLARVLGYAAGGALAASSVSALGAWTQAAPALRPLWTLLHLVFLALGLWWLATGRQPDGWQRDRAVNVNATVSQPTNSRHHALHQAAKATSAGAAWIAWPCGALQAALMLSALASSAPGGALTMAAFAIASAPALALAPWAWGRWVTWRKARGADASAAAMSAVGYRVAGAGLVLAAGWALTHGLWLRVAAWCGL
jgi:uncharacterized protein